MDNASVLHVVKGLIIVKEGLHEAVKYFHVLPEKYHDTSTCRKAVGNRRSPLVVQLGVAGGTLASLGSDPNMFRVRAQLNIELGLLNPHVTWHAVHDDITIIINFVARMVGSLGKATYDIVIMSMNELDEVPEPLMTNQGADSTMRQKFNSTLRDFVLAVLRLL
ncbi:3-carboxy-cis,cis-muconate cycloisomerase [Stagonosporopsis vannaccii]|nr:3-carboxy-cis,cis-muconate cycloisomerase [Stagonosporopsis vannaccii]